MLDYTPGTVSLHVMPWVATGPVSEKLEKELKSKYNMSVWVGYYDSEKEITGVSDERAVALAVIDLLDYIKEKGLDACLPVSKRDGISDVIFYKS